MKRIILYVSLSVYAILMGACNDESKNAATENSTGNTTDIPASVQSSFTSRYPSATDVDWEKESKNDSTRYEAEFRQNDQEMKAYFDENGNFLREEQD